jgi:predicted amidohydrolase YtcJ
MRLTHSESFCCLLRLVWRAFIASTLAACSAASFPPPSLDPQQLAPMTTPSGRDIHEGWPHPVSSNLLLRVSGTKWILDGVPLDGTFLPRTDAATLEQKLFHQEPTSPRPELPAMLRESLRNNDQLMVHVTALPATRTMLEAMEQTGGA